ncbi:MAG TPA: ATP-binding cassette domain-containing protein [Syntrophales bacterium]|nr:ATP-binding cassette domain-containing protein [Syntrophales bacterium]HOM07366.1 ATP-binding cassette domain-containing protein [Syntrophales bacterium]HON98929.1 ATP-binding cassette domain-containing protein [Syntrophales bacterium]HPC00393.1 ATP-binding cassette domain-containing protein [Syntrophales bacterium]HPQ06996.1 ATP-binding cassette domain-containing protein [Syntrophales bacterium]
MEASSLLEVRDLEKVFTVTSNPFAAKKVVIRALDGVTMEVAEGETVGVVGESGCGKTTLGRIVARLEEPTAGEVLFRGRDIFSFTKEELKAYRREVQIVFQDPFASLNPRRTTGGTIEEPLIVHGVKDRAERRRRVMEVMDAVGLPRDVLDRYPHEFSGGQRQRICIARALVLQPSLIVADEPVSALDVSIQAQILNLMKDLQRAFSLAYLFISHDIGVVRFMSDRVVVMYLGKVVEAASNEELFARPCHPYTRLLLEAVPVPDPRKRKKTPMADTYPSSEPLPGADTPCRFLSRCPLRMDICRRDEPTMNEVTPGHFVACHRVPS